MVRAYADPAMQEAVPPRGRSVPATNGDYRALQAMA